MPLRATSRRGTYCNLVQFSDLEACLGCKEGNVCEQASPGCDGPARRSHDEHERLPTDGYLQSAGGLHVSHWSACPTEGCID